MTEPASSEGDLLETDANAFDEPTPGPHGQGKWAMALWLVAGVVGLAFYLATYKGVHSEAAIDFKMDRSQAVAQSKSFLEQQGYDLSNYRHAVGFYTHQNALKFIQKQAPPEQADQLMHGDVLIWYWYVRWFAPLQEEEFAVGFSPDGRLVYYSHHLPEGDARPSVDSEQARSMAEAFLAQAACIDVAATYEPVANDQKKLPERTRHSLTWERRDFDLNGAKYRVYASVDGDRIGYYYQSLHIPEKWLAEETRKESHRKVLTYIGATFEALFTVGVFVVLLLKVRSRQLRSAFALCLGLAVAVVVTLASLNNISTSWMYYHTTESLSTFYEGLFESFLKSLLGGICGFLIFAPPAEALGRDMFPRHVALSRMLSGTFWRSKDVFHAVLVGLCLSMCHLAYYGAFYLLAGKAGAWCPIESPPLNALAMPLPWVEPLQTGLFAALNEELLFRLFAISLLIRLLRRRSIAVVVPAIAWALLHSNYPQEPIYMRALELTPIGIVFGLVFLRYGILATIVGHYTYNAVATGDFMLRTGQPYLVISSALVMSAMALLLLPGLIAVLRGKPLASREEVLQVPAWRFRFPLRFASTEEPVAGPCKPFDLLRFRTAALLGLLGIVAMVALTVVPLNEKFGGFVRVAINRWQAQAIADSFMRARGIAVDDYQRVVSFSDSTNSEGTDYIWQKAGLARLNEVFHAHPLPTAQADVRYFKPLQIEQYRVSIGPDGAVENYAHWLEETGPGARLTQEDARGLSEKYLRDEKGINLDEYRLVDSSSHAYEARTDHWFEWEDTKDKVEDATFRISLNVLGDEPESFSSHIKIPEEWSRARSERHLKDAVVKIMRTVMAIGLGVFTGVLFYVICRRRLVNFRFALTLALAPALCDIIRSLDNLGLFWENYDSSSSPSAFLFSHVLQLFVFKPVAIFCGCAFLTMLLDGFWRKVFPERYPTGHWFGLARFYRNDPHCGSLFPKLPIKKVWAETILVGLFMSGVILALKVTDSRMDLLMHRSIHDHAPKSAVLGGYDSYVPAIDTVFHGLEISILGGMALILLGVAYYAYLRQPVRLILAVTFLSFLHALDQSDTLVDGLKCFGISLACAFAGITLCLLVAKYICRENIMACFMAPFFYLVIPRALEMLRVPERYAFWNGIALICALSALTCWAITVYLKHERLQTETVQEIIPNANTE